MNEKILEEALRRIPLQVSSVRVEGRPGHWVAELSSPDFSTKDETERQRLVWEHLQLELSDEQREQVEFVVAIAPGEGAGEGSK